jgi:uridine kinase
MAGYYRDSFDYEALRRELLEPLGPGGDRGYRTAVFDFRTEARQDLPARRASEDAVLLFDGVFLLRPELRDAWDLRIFVRCSPEESLRRALVRDLDLFGSPQEIERRYRVRYLPGQHLYFQHARPLDHADLVVDNEDPLQPGLSRPCAGDSPC